MPAIGVFFVTTLAVIYGGALWSHIQLARRPDVFNNDVRQQIVPFFRFEDATLFRNDYAGDYYLACFPWGYRVLYTAAAFLGSASALSKSLPYLLLLVAVCAVALAAHRVGGWFAAWASAALCLGSAEYLQSMAGGLPRSFALPLMACVLLALAYGNVRFLVLCTWLGAGFYPVVAVIAGISLAILLLDPIARDRGIAMSWALPKRIGVLVGVALVALLILLPIKVLSSSYGPLIRPAMSIEFPEAGPGGRYSANDRAPYRGPIRNSITALATALPGAGEPLSPLGSWLRSDTSGSRLRLFLLAMLAISSVGWIRLAFRRPEVRRILVLPIATLLGYSLSRLFAPLLYLPSRYIDYGLPGVAVVVLTAGWIGLVPESLRAKRPWLSPTVVAGSCAAVLLLIGGRGSPNVGLDKQANISDPLYKFIRALPADSLLAGWPLGSLNSVPYLTRRQAFVTYETHQAFHTGYALEMRRRMDSLIDAYFATNPEPLVRLNREFGVTHLLINLDLVRRKRGAPYFKPFDRRIDEAVSRIGNQELEVVRQLSNAAVFQHGKVVLLDLQRIETASATVGPMPASRN